MASPRAKAAVVIGDPKQLSHISSLRRGQDQQFLDKYKLLSSYPHWAYSYNSLLNFEILVFEIEFFIFSPKN